MPTRSGRPPWSRADSTTVAPVPRARCRPRRAPSRRRGIHRRAAGGHREPRERGGRPSRASADTPNTPVTLASCATGSTRHLAVAEQHPRKAAEDGEASVLGRHPDGRRQPERTSDRIATSSTWSTSAKIAGNSARYGDQQPGNRRGQRKAAGRRSAPSRRWSSRRCRRSRPRRQSRPRRNEATRRGRPQRDSPLGTGAVPDDGDVQIEQERCQRHPGERRMTVAREAERERDARERGLARNPGAELLFLLELARDLLGVAAFGEPADLHLVDRRLARHAG